MQTSCCQGASLPTTQRLRCQGSGAIELATIRLHCGCRRRSFRAVPGHNSRSQLKFKGASAIRFRSAIRSRQSNAGERPGPST